MKLLQSLINKTVSLNSVTRSLRIPAHLDSDSTNTWRLISNMEMIGKMSRQGNHQIARCHSIIIIIFCQNTLTFNEILHLLSFLRIMSKIN